MTTGEVHEARGLGIGLGVHVTERQHDRVRSDHLAVVEQEVLPPVRAVAEIDGALPMEEVEEAALGGAAQLGPVAGGEQVGGTGAGIAPRGRVEAGAVEGDGEVQ
jgi:hypothetical protein